MSTATAKKLVSTSKLMESGSGGTNRSFIKLRELTADESEKGYYTSLVEGGRITGTLKGTEIDLYKKTNYIIELSNGSEVVVPSAGNLGYKMTPVKVGKLVEIIYNGKTTIKSGPYKGKDAHNFEVLTEEV